MTEARLAVLIDEFAELGGRELFVSGGMEPFSQPRIACLAISHGTQAGLRVRVYSNGIAPALQDESTRNLLALKTQQVRFSIHATDSHTYRRITRPADRNASFLQAFNNVVGLMDARPPMAEPEVGVGLVVLKENVGKLTKAGELWRDVGVDFWDVRFDVFDVIAGADPKPQETLRGLQRLASAGYFDPLSVSIGSFVSGKLHFAPRCYAPFEKLIVDPFGLVWSCCLQSQPGFRPSWAKVGDLESQSLSQIVARLEERFPRDHCRLCTPWEAEYNVRGEQDSRSKQSKQWNGSTKWRI